MKLTRLLNFVVASMMLFTSCGNDNHSDIKLPGTGESYMAVKLVNASGTRNSAREDGTADERYIGNLEFYVFNSNGERDPQLGYQAYQSIQSEYTLAVEPGNGKTVLVTANMGLGDLFEEDGITPARLTTVKKAIYDVEIGEPLTIPVKGIPMSGELIGLAVEDGGVQSVEIVVDRLFAKFETPTVSDRVSVELSAGDEAMIEKLLGGNLRGNIGFDFTGYVVVNGLKKSMVFSPHAQVVDTESQWDTEKWLIGHDYANYTPSIYDNGYLGKTYSGNKFSGPDSEGVYLYENSPQLVEGAVKSYPAGSVYALIVQGDLYDEDNPVNRVTRYWRINVSGSADTENVYRILRNMIYSMEIRKVTSPGCSTPEKAELERIIVTENDIPVMDVQVEIAQWRIFKEG